MRESSVREVLKRLSLCFLTDLVSMRVGYGSSGTNLEVFVEFLKSLDLVVQDAIHILERIVVVIDHHGKSRVGMNETNILMDSALLSQYKDVIS